MIVVDTLFRALAGGDENSSVDMGAVVRNADIIRAQTGACTGYIHHTGKDLARGMRGHSSVGGADDTEIEVTRDKATRISTAEVVRQRDMESGATFSFRLHSAIVGENTRGRAVRSCTVEYVTGQEAKTFGKVAPSRMVFHDALLGAIIKASAGKDDIAQKARAGETNLEAWEAECVWRDLIEPIADNDTAAVKRSKLGKMRTAKSELQAAGYIKIDGGRIFDLTQQYAPSETL